MRRQDTTLFTADSVEKGQTTVVVIPMIAVMQDLIDRCNKSEISLAEWCSASTTMSTTASLLLVSVQQKLTELSFHNHLQALHDAGRLSRIVSDECHVPLTQGGFRSCMQDLVDRSGGRCSAASIDGYIATVHGREDSVMDWAVVRVWR